MIPPTPEREGKYAVHHERKLRLHSKSDYYIIMMVVCTGTMKINFFAKDLQALAGGTGII